MSELQIDLKSLSPALQTAFSYLAEGNWRNANDCFDLELKQSPLDPYACLGKAMTASYLKTPDELNYCTGEILENPFFSAALKYAEGDLKDQLTQLVVRLNYDRQKAFSQHSAIETEDALIISTEDIPSESAEAEPDAAGSNWQNGAASVSAGEKGTDAATENRETGESSESFGVAKGKKKGKKKLIAVLVLVAVVLLAGAGAGTWFYVLPLMKYNKAVDMINNKQFDDGLALFEELGDFSDAKEQYKTGLYVKALNYLANNDFDASREILEELGEFKDAPELIDSIGARRVTLEIRTIAEASVGDIVSFGHFETDGNETNGEEELRWQVLSNRDDLVTLITEQSIAGMRYNFNASATNWSDCSLRTWLNGTFYTSAFEVAEADFICKNYINTPTNPDFPSPSGDATVDKVYLLSLNEALRYFSSVRDRMATCTPASYSQTYTDYNDCCVWWLRTPGARLESAVGVDPTGQVLTVGYDCYRNEQIGVRPVIVVDISAVNGGNSSRQDAVIPEETTNPFDVLETTTNPLDTLETTDPTNAAGTTAPDANAGYPAVTTSPSPSVPQTTAP
jgi:tetratricopeptide (TPR) repeat protein